MEMHCFQDVTVGFPAGGAGAQGAWVHWSTGELRLDGVSRSMVFVPPGQIHAKPFGCLLGARALVDGGGGHTFEVETDDSMHALVRMSFASISDQSAFETLAREAEKLRCYSSQANTQEPFTFAKEDTFSSGLVAALRDRYRGQAPLVFGGAELYGPDPQGDAGSEVLLGRGAVVLLDVQESGRMGSYQLVFHSEDHCEPTQAFFRPWDIGPRTRLAKQMPAEDEFGPSVSFDFSPYGEAPLTLAFDDEEDGEAFGRDVRVRVRLVARTLKISRGRRAAGDLRAELTELEGRGWFRKSRRFLLRSMFLFLALVLAYTCLLLSAEPSRPPLEAAMAALQESASLVSGTLQRAAQLGQTVCEATSDMVPIEDLRRCVAQPDGVRQCLANLTPSGGFASQPASWWGLGELKSFPQSWMSTA